MVRWTNPRIRALAGPRAGQRIPPAAGDAASPVPQRRWVVTPDALRFPGRHVMRTGVNPARSGRPVDDGPRPPRACPPVAAGSPGAHAQLVCGGVENVRMDRRLTGVATFGARARTARRIPLSPSSSPHLSADKPRELKHTFPQKQIFSPTDLRTSSRPRSDDIPTDVSLADHPPPAPLDEEPHRLAAGALRPAVRES